jgi:hypothetical protein
VVQLEYIPSPRFSHCVLATSSSTAHPASISLAKDARSVRCLYGDSRRCQLGDDCHRYRMYQARDSSPISHGYAMTRSNVADRLRLAANKAAERCPQLANHHVPSHAVRHSIVTHLLQSGIDLSVIALWPGRESPSTAHGYLEADLATTERTLNSIQPTTNPRYRCYQPTDDILRFLESLKLSAARRTEDRCPSDRRLVSRSSPNVD